MEWKQFLAEELEAAYRVTDDLFTLAADTDLGWKPPSGSNWMTTGQLLMHVAMSNGPSFKGFVSGEWGLPDGTSLDDMEPEEMLPPAEALPAVGSVEEARELLADDREMAFEILDSVSEAELEEREMAAPWDPGRNFSLGRHLLFSIRHMLQHKGQLFYYLKLQGKAVDTRHLWGM